MQFYKKDAHAAKSPLNLFAVTALTLALAACGGSDGGDPAPQAPETPAPETPVEATPSAISLKHLGRHETGQFAVSAAEITAYDAQSQRAFVVNAQSGKLDVLDMKDPAHPRHVGIIDATPIAAGATVNSVAVKDGIVALAIEAAVKTDTGYVAFYQAADSSYVSHVSVGALPDMLTFTPDGKTVLVANEGEPSDDYQIDPEGSISVIDISAIEQPVVRTADFRAFNDQKQALLQKGVRVFGPDQTQALAAGATGVYRTTTVAQDMEPEYIAVSADGKWAWATLQENNALAKIDIENAKVLDILPLGYKDHGLAGNGMDVYDEDKTLTIDIRPRPGVFGMYLPDAVAAYSAQGKTYLVTANEGDARAWGEDNAAYFGQAEDAKKGVPALIGDPAQGFVEELRVKHLVHKDGFARRLGDDMPAHLIAMAEGALLDPSVFAYCGAEPGNKPGDCRDDEELGRLKISWTQGYKLNDDGSPKFFDKNGNENPAGRWLMYDKLYAYGARSFSIFDEDGALVWDAGDQFERFLASNECRLRAARDLPCADFFNSQHDEGDAKKDRSDDKGPEPEGVEIGVIGEKTFAFIGLERMGGVLAYDITDPNAPVFQDYLNTRENWVDNPETALASAGDLGPEGLKFVPAADAPGGKPLLIVGFEVSGTTSVFEIEQRFDK
ncbi:choice-of-anchor I family protein [Pusillimonas sp. CC-YST705]|uniref:Choice-of-anchor I family protein n=2 Tax=Mesopusillimonas faecipullorum TaxID=2755040 RepID=A0ABS8CBH1_9BURK|nr:choice-of-anchor I family protein [Mesopusillimonas faecipullorum]